MCKHRLDALTLKVLKMDSPLNLSGLLPLLRNLPGYAEMRATLEAATPRGWALNLPRAARPPLAAALAEDAAHSAGRPIIFITARPDRSLTLLEELAGWSPTLRLLAFNEPNAMFYEPATWGLPNVRARIQCLAALAAYFELSSFNGVPPVILASARALMTRTLPRHEFTTHTSPLNLGQSVRLETLLKSWVALGYEAGTIVSQPGQFSRRGGLLDIYPMADEWPVRVELFGDEIETLRRFDPATQRSGEKVEHVTVTPAREVLQTTDDGRPTTDGEARPLEFELPLHHEPASLLEYAPYRSLVIVEDWQELADAVSELEEHAAEQRALQLEAELIDEDFPRPYFTWRELEAQLLTRQPFVLGARGELENIATAPLGTPFHRGPRFGGQVKPVIEQIERNVAEGDAVIIISRQAQRLAELWSARAIPTAVQESITEMPQAGQALFLNGHLAEGWRLDWTTGDGRQTTDEASSTIQHPSSVHLFTDAEIFGVSRAQPRRREQQRRAAPLTPEAIYALFSLGDYIVHEDFGVGRFRELGKRSIDGLEREYLVLEFAEGDELYVPVYQADRLTKYVGASDQPPTLTRLGSAEWTTAKTKAQQATAEMARELLELYAKRELVSGHGFGLDSTWQTELEGAFPFVETEDQLRAIQEVKADMERARPMDRLICGDVGFGKTEVALRAAFKAVMDGTQVAILVPTTVLAQQHFHTFHARMAPYPVKVEMLSRFRTPAQSRAILQQLAEGQVDIIVGTHKLLSKDVQFKNLGLLIVDEEQRFGVTHKERLKRLRTEVDVLTLTATPIPRTLYMALTGIRDISTINTPPEERLPIITHVSAYNEKLVRQAILRELDRGGQIFFVHNRVQSIGLLREKLEQLVPEARLGVGHGQMDEHELEKVMEEYSEGKLDLLLCTSIIESGLDIPNANTLIVDRADTFGLAQLYQLRGRVGRSATQAYAYFFTDKAHRPTQEARERLETLAEQTELGAGYSIAMRDLEMRGAGDIIGPKQSGQITAVGFHLYTRLLGQAVRRIKKEQITDAGPQTPEGSSAPLLTSTSAHAETNTVTVDLPFSIAIPADYVEDRALRLQLYQRLANVSDEASLDALRLELADRFGPVPRALNNLLFQLRVKILAARVGVLAVGVENGQITLSLPSLDEVEQAYFAFSLVEGARTSKNKIWLPKLPEAEWRETLVAVLQKLASEKLASLAV